MKTFILVFSILWGCHANANTIRFSSVDDATNLRANIALVRALLTGDEHHLLAGYKLEVCTQPYFLIAERLRDFRELSLAVLNQFFQVEATLDLKIENAFNAGCIQIKTLANPPYSYAIVINHHQTHSFILEPGEAFEAREAFEAVVSPRPSFMPVPMPCEGTSDPRNCQTKVSCTDDQKKSPPPFSMNLYSDPSRFKMNPEKTNDPKLKEMSEDVPDLDLDLLVNLYLTAYPIDESYLYDEVDERTITSDEGYDAIQKLVGIARDGLYAVGVPGVTNYSSDVDDDGENSTENQDQDENSVPPVPAAPLAPVLPTAAAQIQTTHQMIDDIDQALSLLLAGLLPQSQQVNPLVRSAPDETLPTMTDQSFIPEQHHGAQTDDENSDDDEEDEVVVGNTLRHAAIDLSSQEEDNEDSAPQGFTIDKEFQIKLQKSLNRLLAKLLSMEDQSQLSPIMGMLAVRAVHCAPSITGFISDLMTNLAGKFAQDLHQRLAADLGEWRKTILIRSLPKADARHNAHGYKLSFAFGAKYGLPELELSNYEDIFSTHAEGTVNEAQVEELFETNHTAPGAVEYIGNQFVAIPGYFMLIKEWAQTLNINVQPFISADTGRLDPAFITFVLHQFGYLIPRPAPTPTGATNSDR